MLTYTHHRKWPICSDVANGFHRTCSVKGRLARTSLDFRDSAIGLAKIMSQLADYMTRTPESAMAQSVPPALQIVADEGRWTPAKLERCRSRG